MRAGGIADLIAALAYLERFARPENLPPDQRTGVSAASFPIVFPSRRPIHRRPRSRPCILTTLRSRRGGVDRCLPTCECRGNRVSASHGVRVRWIRDSGPRSESTAGGYQKIATVASELAMNPSSATALLSAAAARGRRLKRVEAVQEGGQGRVSITALSCATISISWLSVPLSRASRTWRSRPRCSADWEQFKERGRSKSMI